MTELKRLEASTVDASSSAACRGPSCARRLLCCGQSSRTYHREPPVPTHATARMRQKACGKSRIWKGGDYMWEQRPEPRRLGSPQADNVATGSNALTRHRTPREPTRRRASEAGYNDVGDDSPPVPRTPASELQLGVTVSVCSLHIFDTTRGQAVVALSRHPNRCRGCGTTQKQGLVSGDQDQDSRRAQEKGRTYPRGARFGVRGRDARPSTQTPTLRALVTTRLVWLYIRFAEGS